MNRRSTFIICAAAAALLLVTAPAATASPADRKVKGTWQAIVPVAITSYQPSPSDPTTGTFEGSGSTLWQGTFTGVTRYTARGTADLITGAGSGTLDETFVGRSSDGGTGTITFTETYTLDAYGEIHIDARITGGTGDFAGARGWVDFDGTMTGVATGSGTYHGHWTLPEGQS